jgi:hypothetical protein
MIQPFFDYYGLKCCELGKQKNNIKAERIKISIIEPEFDFLLPVSNKSLSLSNMLSFNP